MKQRPAAAVILCYHALAASPKTAYAVSLKNFKQQMDWIGKRGYHVIALDSLARLLRTKAPLPDSLVLITFDDGYKSVYDYGWPILKKHKFPFAVFVYTNYIGAGKASLSWNQVRKMSQAGVLVGSHSVSHPILTRIDGMTHQAYHDWIWKELAKSRDIISQKLKKDVTYFAYPFGAFDDTVAALAKQAGYTSCLMVNGGINDAATSPFELDRIIITRRYQFSLFKKILDRHRIDLADLNPLQGEEVGDSAGQVISARIGNAVIDKRKSLSFTVSRAKGTAIIDTTKGLVRFTLKQPLKKGLHEAMVAGENIYGQKCYGCWLFVVRD